VVGVAIGLTCLRLDGDYLALATFGTVVILNSVAQNWVSLTRGAMGISGIPRICVGGLERKTEFAYVLLIACIVSLTGLGLRWCVASPFGRVLRSIRDDEVAAQALGKDTARYKLIAFSLGAFLAGVAGGLYAHYVSFIGPSTFGVTESLTMVLMVVLGGLGSLRGSLVGAAILVSIPEALRLLGIPSAIAAESKLMLYGLLLIVLMLWRPRGVFGSYGL
jgi:branched-chain amino acid transport system permease protein